MRVINDYPPLFKEIAATFKLHPGVLFSWGDRIYYPEGGPIHPAILAHEAAHGKRQGLTEQGVIAWWQRYLHDKEFRCAEEIIGHQAELQWYIDAKGDSRVNRRYYTSIIAKKLAAPLYGPCITYAEARRVLSGGIKRNAVGVQRHSIASLRLQRGDLGL